MIESVSDEKRTALGTGHFVTQRITYRDQTGEIVATQMFRMLKFKPASAARSEPQASDASGARSEPQASEVHKAQPRPRPKPAITHDNRFFWEGVAQRELRIQRCNACGRLQHPPGPMCSACHALDLGFVVSRGRGKLYSFVVAHHPAIPPFVYPNLIALVALDEGTRIVSNLVGVAREDVRIGMPLALEFAEDEPGRLLPRFRPAA
jgi:uncharacterized OB-fold protein